MAPARLTRRAAIGLAASLPVAGCGWQPLYAPTAGGTSVAAKEFAAVDVALIPERSGQLLRQALQARLNTGSLAVPKRYTLRANLAISIDSIGILPDTTSTRQRISGVGTWTLLTMDAAPVALMAGSARSTDGLNVIDSQFFAVDLETETVTRRIAEAVADQITTQLAIYFKRRAEPPRAT